MAAPQQIGASSGTSEVPVYYVPPPGESPNFFAQLVAGFLQTRTPAAMMLDRKSTRLNSSH